MASARLPNGVKRLNDLGQPEPGMPFVVLFPDEPEVSVQSADSK
jgi:hypothetical protein